MPQCPCPAQALLNTQAARLCAKRKTTVMGRDAKDLAKGIVRADWLQFSSEEQSRSRESERRRRPIHPVPAHAEPPPPPPPPPTHIPARTHTFTQTQRTLIFITIIWLFYHNQKSTTLRLPFLTFLFCLLSADSGRFRVQL